MCRTIIEFPHRSLTTFPHRGLATLPHRGLTMFTHRSLAEKRASVIVWDSNFNESCAEHERVCVVEGRESLTKGSWEPTNSNSRFSRVKTEMP